jgi:hypothetical protein
VEPVPGIPAAQETGIYNDKNVAAVVMKSNEDKAVVYSKLKPWYLLPINIKYAHFREIDVWCSIPILQNVHGVVPVRGSKHKDVKINPDFEV